LTKRRPITDSMKMDVLRSRLTLVVCPGCLQMKPLHQMQFDHHLALVDGGKHTVENIRPFCIPCHREKSAHEHKENCRAKRRAKKHRGEHVSKHPMPKTNRKIPAHVNPWGKR
jgi:5-methylcytosine-specific restriction endonuclease McrA